MFTPPLAYMAVKIKRLLHIISITIVVQITVKAYMLNCNQNIKVKNPIYCVYVLFSFLLFLTYLFI